MAKDKKKLGEILLEEGLLNEDSLANALAEQRKWGGRLGSLLIRMGLVKEAELVAVLERQLGIRCISLQGREVDGNALKLIPVDIAKQYTIFPVRLTGKTMTVAMVDPLDISTIDDLQFRLNARVMPALALESDIKRAIAIHYEGAIMESFAPPMRPTAPPSGEAPVFMHSFAGGTDVTQDDRPREAPAVELEEEPARVSSAPSHKEVLEGLVTLLIEKGIIGREELLERLRKG